MLSIEKNSLYPTHILPVTVCVDCDGYLGSTICSQKYRHNRHKPSRRLKTQTHFPSIMASFPAITNTIFI